MVFDVWNKKSAIGRARILLVAMVEKNIVDDKATLMQIKAVLRLIDSGVDRSAVTGEMLTKMRRIQEILCIWATKHILMNDYTSNFARIVWNSRKELTEPKSGIKKVSPHIVTHLGDMGLAMALQELGINPNHQYTIGGKKPRKHCFLPTKLNKLCEKDYDWLPTDIDDLGKTEIEADTKMEMIRYIEVYLLLVKEELVGLEEDQYNDNPELLDIMTKCADLVRKLLQFLPRENPPSYWDLAMIILDDNVFKYVQDICSLNLTSIQLTSDDVDKFIESEDIPVPEPEKEEPESKRIKLETVLEKMDQVMKTENNNTELLEEIRNAVVKLGTENDNLEKIKDAMEKIGTVVYNLKEKVDAHIMNTNN